MVAVVDGGGADALDGVDLPHGVDALSHMDCVHAHCAGVDEDHDAGAGNHREDPMDHQGGGDDDAQVAELEEGGVVAAAPEELVAETVDAPVASAALESVEAVAFGMERRVVAPAGVDVAE